MSNQQKPAKKHPLKKTYLGYYYLVTHFNPHDKSTIPSEQLIIKTFEEYKAGTPSQSSVDGPLKQAEDLLVKKGKMEKAMEHPDFPYLEPNFEYLSDKFFFAFVNKGIPLLHTKDGKFISCVGDVERLWKELGLKPLQNNLQERISVSLERAGIKLENLDIKSKDSAFLVASHICALLIQLTKEYIAKIEAYLSPEHMENLKKLSQDEELTEPGKEGIEGNTINIINVTGPARIGQIQQAGTKAEKEQKPPSKAKNKSYWKLISGVVAFIASITCIIDFITNRIGFLRFIIGFFKSSG